MAEYIVDTTEGILHARTTGELVRCRDCKHLQARALRLDREVKSSDGCTWGSVM